MASNLQNNTGIFVPETNVWDVEQLSSVNVNTPEFKELLVRLYQNINNISVALNLKDSAYYVEQEFVNSQLFFPNPAKPASQRNPRPVFRKVVSCGALLNNGISSIPHGIHVTNATTFTRMYGTANDPIAMIYYPVPYVNFSNNNNIQLYCDATNIYIETGSDRTNFTITYVVLEYIKE